MTPAALVVAKRCGGAAAYARLPVAQLIAENTEAGPRCAYDHQVSYEVLVLGFRRGGDWHSQRLRWSCRRDACELPCCHDPDDFLRDAVFQKLVCPGGGEIEANRRSRADNPNQLLSRNPGVRQSAHPLVCQEFLRGERYRKREAERKKFGHESPGKITRDSNSAVRQIRVLLLSNAFRCQPRLTARNPLYAEERARGLR